jgi:hypothetical protein
MQYNNPIQSNAVHLGSADSLAVRAVQVRKQVGEGECEAEGNPREGQRADHESKRLQRPCRRQHHHCEPPRLHLVERSIEPSCAGRGRAGLLAPNGAPNRPGPRSDLRKGARASK